MFNAHKFYTDNHIENADSGSKHTREGWINIHCPFCRGNDYHLGFSLSTGAYKCWKCGNHSQLEVIKTLLNCAWGEADAIQKSYESKIRPSKRAELSAQGKTHATVCNWPVGTNDLSERGINYLVGRKYDAELLKAEWGLRETGHLGAYKFRIIAPIMINGVMVSYQGRDVTGLSGMKYKACRQENEVMEHQTVVYGLDQAKGEACIVVEGIADVWRLGPGAVCCFGIAFTLAQINMLADKFKTVYVLFDAEEQAQKQAREMAVLLSARGVNVELLELEHGDPGEMTQKEADELMEELNL